MLGREEGRCPRGLERASNCWRIFFAVVLMGLGKIEVVANTDTFKKLKYEICRL